MARRATAQASELTLTVLVNPQPDPHATYFERNSHRAIDRALELHRNRPYEQLRMAMADAYPFGNRHGRAYKVWIHVLQQRLEKLAIEHGKTPRKRVNGRDS